MIKVCELTNEEIEEIREARQTWGSQKYGDRDQYRDTAKDLLEETLDIKNILNRRLFWLEKEKNKDLKIDIAATEILILYNNMIEAIKNLDNALRVASNVTDKNSHQRIGFNYIEHLREIEKANKAQNIEGV